MTDRILCPHCEHSNDYNAVTCTTCSKPIGRKFDEGKVEWTLLPWKALEAIVLIMMFGAKKYARDNWKHVEPPTRYLDACLRHLTAWLNGFEKDEETGYSHLWHAGCCIVFCIYLEMDGKLKCPKGKS